MFEKIRSILGTNAESEAISRPEEKLYDFGSNHITMETKLNMNYVNKAGLCFDSASDPEFREVIEEIESIISIEQNSNQGSNNDWIVIEADGFEELLSEVYQSSKSFIDRGFGSRMICAAFCFTEESSDVRNYWIYSFDRGKYYPFAPRLSSRRDNSIEMKMQTALQDRIPLEQDESYWYPVWPPDSNSYIWEPNTS